MHRCGLLMLQVFTRNVTSVCPSVGVCVLVTTVSPAKTAQPTEMWFRELSRVGARNGVHMAATWQIRLKEKVHRILRPGTPCTSSTTGRSECHAAGALGRTYIAARPPRRNRAHYKKTSSIKPDVLNILGLTTPPEEDRFTARNFFCEL